MDCVDESYEHWHVLHIKENVGGKHRKLLGRKKSLLDIIFVVHLHHTPNDSSSFKLKLSEKSEMNRETEARKPFCFFSASYLMVNTCQARNVYCKARESSLSPSTISVILQMYMNISKESRLIEKDVLIY